VNEKFPAARLTSSVAGTPTTGLGVTVVVVVVVVVFGTTVVVVDPEDVGGTAVGGETVVVEVDVQPAPANRSMDRMARDFFIGRDR